MGDEGVIADEDAAVRGDDGSDQGAEVADLDFALWAEVEECSVVDAAIVADAEAPEALASVMEAAERAIAPAPFSEADIGGEGLGNQSWGSWIGRFMV